MRSFYKWPLVLLALLWLSVPVQAQRGELVEDLLRTLIESQTNRGRDRGPGQGPAPNAPPANAPRPIGRPDPALRAILTEVQDMSTDAMLLAQSLQAESRGQPQLRPQLGRLIQLQAALDNMNRGGPLNSPVDVMARDFALIDRDWRTVEYQLLQVPDLSPRSRGLVEHLSQHDRTLCQLLGVEPQLDRTELVRLAGELTTSYRQLLDDMYLDLRRNPQLPALLQEGQQLQLQIRQATISIDRVGYDQLVAEYKKTQAAWRRFSNNLHPVATERMRRSMFRVEQSGRAIQQQLWIPVELDVILIQQLVQTVEADAQRLMASIALPDLLTHPQPDRVLKAAREFHVTCGTFSTASKGPFDRESLLWDYRLFEVQWQAFADQCRGFKSPIIQQQLVDVENRLGMLRSALGLDSGLDVGQLTQLAAGMDELCFQLEQTAEKRVLNSGQYNRQFLAEFAEELEVLHTAAHQFHEATSQPGNSRHLTGQVEALVRSWGLVKKRVSEFRPEHQQILYQTIAQIEPSMVNLQVMFIR